MARPIKQRDKWRIRWIDANGKRKSEVYEKLKEAERALRQHELEAEEVRLGLRSPLPPDKTLDELFDYWLANRAIHKRSKGDDESIIRRHLRPHFGSLRLRELRVEHVDAFSATKAHLNPKTLANHLTLLRTMLNCAVELGWLAKVPNFKKPRIPLFSNDYRYLRTDDEISRFLRAAAREGELVYVFYAVALYTGMRAGEVASLQWDDIDFTRRLITVQRSFWGPTKSGKVRYVPILDPLLPILRSWRLKHPGRLVFTSETGEMFGKSARIFQEVLHRVLDAAGLKATRRGRRLIRHITFHGLRHTFASMWVAKGGDLFKLQKILGHASITMTQRYAHLAPHLYAEDHGRFGDEAPRPEGRVVKLRTRKVSPSRVPSSDHAKSGREVSASS